MFFGNLFLQNNVINTFRGMKALSPRHSQSAEQRKGPRPSPAQRRFSGHSGNERFQTKNCAYNKFIQIKPLNSSKINHNLFDTVKIPPISVWRSAGTATKVAGPTFISHTVIIKSFFTKVNSRTTPPTYSLSSLIFKIS